jgi:hypothetical protein
MLNHAAFDLNDIRRRAQLLRWSLVSSLVMTTMG